MLDFGLVKSVEGGTGEHSLATAAGLTPGTPAYMAPEMALGEAFDGRADLYALGCVAYYLLTGQLVFEAANGLQMIARAHARYARPPVPAGGAPRAGGRWSELVLACLAKEPAGRPRSAGELSRALAAIEGEPWGEEQAEEWWRVNRPG